MRIEPKRVRSNRKTLRGLNIALLGLLTALPAAGPAVANSATSMDAATSIGVGPMGRVAVAPPCPSAPPEQPDITEVPWTARWFQPERIWPISRGSGVTVAVIDSGVDAQHPQLDGGAVREGFDLVTGSPGGDGDCDAHGTAVASIIAARRVSGVGFVGLAPAASILPLRVAERGVDPDARGSQVDPGLFAAALRQAADGGARVINASVVFTTDHAEVAEAVRYAQGRGAVVVAAVGNHHTAGSIGPDATPYPAAYPGVLGVGAVGEDGTLVPNSYVGPHVDLVAPGSAVVAATRGSGHARWTGTSFAAPFVSAAAALVIARDRSRSGPEVVRQLLATADPPAGGMGYGHGVVNPYRALTERVIDDEPVAGAPLPRATQDPAVIAAAQREGHTRRLAIIVSMVVIGVALVVAALVVARTRGGARPAASPVEEAAVKNIEDPEREFYTVPVARTARAAKGR